MLLLMCGTVFRRIRMDFGNFLSGLRSIVDNQYRILRTDRK